MFKNPITYSPNNMGVCLRKSVKICPNLEGLAKYTHVQASKTTAWRE